MQWMLLELYIGAGFSEHEENTYYHLVKYDKELYHYLAVNTGLHDIPSRGVKSVTLLNDRRPEDRLVLWAVREHIKIRDNDRTELQCDPGDTTMQTAEKSIIVQAMLKAGGIQREAAIILGISRGKLHRRLKKFNLIEFCPRILADVGINVANK